ncbi:MAG: SGNH/GDSL hydrolase family protein [Actinomycetota bacterium]|nr:SGNH/GDSL hydrolase family protein [Actinomycetota bacterium]
MTPRMAPAELRDPHCLTLEAGARLLDGHPFRRVVVLGDSVAAGVREPMPGYLDLSMADRLQDALSDSRPDLSFTNLAVSGAKIAEVTSDQLDRALALRADLAVVSAGGNDAFERGFDAGRAAGQLAHLAARLSEAGALVVLIGLFDLGGAGLLPPEVAERMSAKFATLDEAMHVAAEEVPGCVVSDNRSHPLSHDPSIYASDLIHCNTRGHAVAAATLLRDVSRLAASAGTSEPTPGRPDGWPRSA